jgi:hypothetical protein
MASSRRWSVWSVCAAVAVAGSVLSLVWTESASTQGVPNIPGWRCYAAKTAKGTAKFTARDVFWNGSLQQSAATVLKPVAYCDPVNNSQINNTVSALACYKIKDVQSTPKFAGAQINISTPFGDETLDLKKSNTVCVSVSSIP